VLPARGQYHRLRQFRHPSADDERRYSGLPSLRLSHPPSPSFHSKCSRRREDQENEDANDDLSGSEFEYGDVTFNDGDYEEEEEFYEPREGEEWEETEWDDGEPEDDNDGAPDVNTAAKHATRMQKAKEEGDALVGHRVKVHDTTWTVIKEHHDPAPDVCGPTKLRDFNFNRADWTLLELLKHVSPGDPELDVDRANAFMAAAREKWTYITPREWYTFQGILVGGSLGVQKVRTTRASLDTTTQTPGASL